MQYGIKNDDVLEWARNYEGEKFHAMLCDPPYELGFMGKDWDRSGIAFQPETWAALAEHLHDGAFGMAFASSRGWHRMAVAIEDAGLIIHPTIWLWNYATGFPKATRIDTQIDKAAKVDCPDCGGRVFPRKKIMTLFKPVLDFVKSKGFDYQSAVIAIKTDVKIPLTDSEQATNRH